MKFIKIILKWLLLLFTIVIVLPVMIMCCTHVIPNNIKLMKLNDKLEAVNAPEGSRKLKSLKYIGTVYGNGTGRCDLISGILYETNNYDAVYKYFRDKQIQSTRQDGKDTIDIELIRLKDSDKEVHIGNAAIPLKTRCGNGKSCYFIYVYDYSEQYYDIRCN